MECPSCHIQTPGDANQCAACGAFLETETIAHAFGAAAVRVRATVKPILEEGVVLGGRYEVLRRLGRGGMGEVYKARDMELDRVVALKIIHPTSASDQQKLDRFKQELVLARKVGHKNVVRTFDLEVVGDLKFITMDYVEGKDLAQVIRERTLLKVPEAMAVIRQVCDGLGAAHAEGVIHRDLKPTNIMIDSHGRVLILDFGLAQSPESPDLTRPNEVVGTLMYMAPEQYTAGIADARSDLFALGLIFYQLLTGESAFIGKTTFDMLRKRSAEPPVSPHDRNPDVPVAISMIVMKCLECDPDQRYQTAADLLEALDNWERKERNGEAEAVTGPVEQQRLPVLRLRIALVVSGVILMLAFAGWWWRATSTASHGVNSPLTLLIADFANQTGERVLDETLEPVFVLAMEGAPFIACYDRGQARRLVTRIKPDGPRLDDGLPRLDNDVARLIAHREGIAAVLTGSVKRNNAGYSLHVSIVDAITGRQIVANERAVGKKEELLNAVPKLAGPLRKALGDTTFESGKLSAAETFTTGSLEAAHQYALAQGLQFNAKYSAALQGYLRAINLDSRLGRAYAGAGTMYLNLGQRNRALYYFQLALSNSNRMTERERYRTFGGYYIRLGDNEHAIEQYRSLVNQYPSDTAGHSNLALAYFYTYNFSLAVQEGDEAVKLYPNIASHRNNLAWYAMYAGDFDRAEREALNVQSMNSSFEKAYVVLALTRLAKKDFTGAEDAYRQLEKVSVRGASLAADGLADYAVSQGRLRDAESILGAAIENDLKSKDLTSAARKREVLASVNLMSGRTADAIRTAARALEVSRDDRLMFSTARIYLEAGYEDRARALLSGLQAGMAFEDRVQAGLLDGELELHRNHARTAIDRFRAVQKFADTWLGHFDLGQAYLKMGLFAEAYSEFDNCLRRRGEGVALFLDDVPTYRYVPLIYYYMGRAEEGLGSPGAVDSYRLFLSIKKSNEDPLAGDARRRIADQQEVR